MAIITLVYAAQSIGAGYITISGAAAVSCSGGETIVIACAGLRNTNLGDPTDSAGTLTKQTVAYNAFNSSNETQGGFYTSPNAGAGTHTITPPAIAGGEDGLIAVWRVSGMPAALNVRTAGKLHQVTASNTITINTTGSATAGDVAFGMRTHENTVGSTDTITKPAGWTSDAQYLDGSLNLPTDWSHVTVPSTGILSGTWVDVDPAINDTGAAILVLVPLSASRRLTLLGAG